MFIISRRSKLSGFRSSFKSLLKENWCILFIMALILIGRIIGMNHFGITYNLGSDDLEYVKSGINFAVTGTITMRENYPTAQIMPGMTYIFSVLYLIFGEGEKLWLAAKGLWFLMAALTALYVYRTVKLHFPKWCAIFAVLPFLRPDYVWLNNTALTETPFLLALSAALFYSMRLCKDRNSSDFYKFLIAFLAGLLIRANMISFPVFLFFYLFIAKYDKKQLLKFGASLLFALSLFVIPWSIRNYLHFDAFIPLTYGSGNPTLLGTYQGINYPPDENVDCVSCYNPAYTLSDVAAPLNPNLPIYERPDYETNVANIARLKFDRYYDENGELLPQYKNYVSLETDGIKAQYRIRLWAKTDPVNFLYSYLYVKPKYMLNSIFYWRDDLGAYGRILRNTPKWENLICLLGLIFIILQKKHRFVLTFPLAVYLGNIMIYSMGYSFERYNTSIISPKYIFMGISIGILCEACLGFIKAIPAWNCKRNQPLKK